MALHTANSEPLQFAQTLFATFGALGKSEQLKSCDRLLGLVPYRDLLWDGGREMECKLDGGTEREREREG